VETGIQSFQLHSECGYAQLKRLPTETVFDGVPLEDLSSEPLLKRIEIETTAEDGISDKYELLEQAATQFGSMKVLTSSGLDLVRVQVHITDNGLKNAGQ
jgi:hypothetical protein